MKKILTKVGYMAFGCLLTVIGYHFGNIDNNSADAQLVDREKAQIVDEIRCRKLVIVGTDNTPRIILDTNFFNHGNIRIHNKDGTSRVYLGAEDGDRGVLEIYGKEAVGVAVALSVDDNGGYMALWNKVLDKPVLQTGITE